MPLTAINLCPCSSIKLRTLPAARDNKDSIEEKVRTNMTGTVTKVLVEIRTTQRERRGINKELLESSSGLRVLICRANDTVGPSPCRSVTLMHHVDSCVAEAGDATHVAEDPDGAEHVLLQVCVGFSCLYMGRQFVN